MKCAECEGDLPVGKVDFCSKSCSTRHHNRTSPKRRRKVRVCRACPNEANKNTSYCAECIAKGRHLHIKPLTDMQTDGTRKRHLLRTRPYRCEGPGCGISEWLGVPAPLELDHVDGNSDNNTEENLRLLCPNCHALTPSAKGKNRGRGRTRQRMKNDRYAQGLKY